MLFDILSYPLPSFSTIIDTPPLTPLLIPSSHPPLSHPLPSYPPPFHLLTPPLPSGLCTCLWALTPSKLPSSLTPPPFSPLTLLPSYYFLSSLLTPPPPSLNPL